ncbi:MAG: SurA N-terminal domain-containing protein [Spirochaetota bacterium]
MKTPTINKTLYVSIFLLFAAMLLIFAGCASTQEAQESTESEAQDSTETSEFEQLKPALRERLLQQKQEELITEHLEDLRAEASVETFLNDYEEGSQQTVLATVNGVDIVKQNLVQFEQQQAARAGFDPQSEEATQVLATVRQQMLDQLIYTELLQQQVEKENISPTAEQIDNEYEQYAQQYGGVETLEQMLAQQGLTEDEIKVQIRSQLAMQTYLDQYISEHFDPDSVEITEEELKEYYEALKQQQLQQQQ